MANIAVISSSVRTGRKSDRVASYFVNFLQSNNLASVDLLDLKEFNFPIFQERLMFLKDNAPDNLKDFANRFNAADGILIVTPEYNGNIPASLINVMDVLFKEWYHKPVAIAGVSSGAIAGARVVIHLQASLWKLQAMCVPSMFNVGFVEESYDEQGVPVEKEKTDKIARRFIDEFLFTIRAVKNAG